MKWRVEIKDGTTNQYIVGGNFNLEELLSWDYKDYRIEFSDKNSKNI